MRVANLLVASLIGLSANAWCAPPSPAEIQHARDIFEHAVNMPTTEANAAVQVPLLAAYLADQLRAAGFEERDLDIQRIGNTAGFIARYHGTGKGKPIIVSGHMDVVEAMPKDWVRDPFKMVDENGFFYGRGTVDMKFDLSMIVATLAHLKQQGYQPVRDIVLAASGDEESHMVSTQALAKQLRGAEMDINADGEINEIGANGKPLAFLMQAAEKTYASFELHAKNPGGHSSWPRADNAIYDIAHALDRVEQYAFPTQINEVTRSYLSATASRVDKKLGDALRRILEDPHDAKALALIEKHPEYSSMLHTTCVATMLKAGHAENALPQEAVATINCRILPGTSVDSVRDTLAATIANPAIAIVLLQRQQESAPSPLRPDLLAALRKAVDTRYPGLEILPMMAVGASDTLHYRSVGIPSYDIISVYMRPSDYFAHGLNERVPAEIAPSLAFWDVLLRELGSMP